MLYLPEKYLVGFTYAVEVLGPDGNVQSIERVKNLMPAASIAYQMAAAWTGGTQYTSWYLSLFENNYTPVSSDTMTTLLASAAENTTYTTTGGARLTFAPAEILNGTWSTAAAPSVFEFTVAATIRGAFITSNVTRGNTSGLLVSAVKFATAKSIEAGGALRVPAGIALVAV